MCGRLYTTIQDRNTSFVALGEIMLPAEQLSVVQCGMSASASRNIVICVRFFDDPILVFALGRTHGADALLTLINMVLHSIGKAQILSVMSGIADSDSVNACKVLTNADYCGSLDYRNSLGGAI